MSVTTCSKCGAKNRVDENGSSNRRAVCGRCGAELSSESERGKPRIVSDATFTQDVIKVAGVPVLVDCWAEWCGPCRMIAPVLDELAAESDGRYVIAKLNVDENPQTAGQFNIRNIPTMLIFKNGELVDRIVGLQSKQAIAARLL